MRIIPALRRLRQEDQEFKGSLDNLVRLYLKIKYKRAGDVPQW
jgi:hypothetical protein